MSGVHEILPTPALREGLPVGRVWPPAPHGGPGIALFDLQGIHDISHLSPTMSQLLEYPNLCQTLRGFPRIDPISSIEQLLEGVPFGGRKGSSYGPREQGSYAREFFTTAKTAYITPYAAPP
jgi:hypothetical protein